jgi:hypothetical protein
LYGRIGSLRIKVQPDIIKIIPVIVPDDNIYLVRYRGIGDVEFELGFELTVPCMLWNGYCSFIQIDGSAGIDGK